MNNAMRVSFLLAFAIIMSSCYNNSHIRTQRVLEPGDKIIATNASLNFVAPDDYNNDSYRIEHGGVAGLRAGISYLTYRNGYEQGASLEYGGGSGDYTALALGYDIRKVIPRVNASPYRYGLHAEFNHLKSSDDYHRIKGGSVVQLRPYIMSTTSPRKEWYGGIHGLLSFGSIQATRWTWSSSHYDEIETEFSYGVSSLGIGLSLGNEFGLGGMLVQTQLDVSYISQQHEVDVDDYDEIVSLDNYYGGLEPLKSTGPYASLGIAFSQAPKSEKKRARVPMQLNELPQHSPPPQFDPFTGEMITQTPTPKKLEFDPFTGEVLKSESTTFDPFTGLPVGADEPRSLLSPQERSLLIVKGLKIHSMNGAISTAVVQDVKTSGLVVYRESRGKPVVETIAYKHIRSIKFEGGRKGIKKGVNSAIVGCTACIALPLGATILTGEPDLFFLGVVGAPVVGLGTLFATALGSAKYEIEFDRTTNRSEYKRQLLTHLVKTYVESGFPDYAMTDIQIKP